MAYDFTYGSFDSSALSYITVVNKHEPEIRDDTLTVRVDFLLTADTDAEYNTRVDDVYLDLSRNDVAFTLTLGSETILTWSPTANTGFLMRGTVRKVAGPEDTSRSALFRFTAECQKEPGDSNRAGRRRATLSVAYTGDRFRRLTVSGVWTALTGPTTALDAHADGTNGLQQWLSDDWLGSGDPLAPASGNVWQLVGEPQLSVEDENKLINFTIVYQETRFSSTPTNTTGAIYTQCVITRADPGSFGARMGLGSSGGEGSPLQDPTATSAGGAGGGSGTSVVPEDPPKRYHVTTQTWVTDTSLNLNTFFNDVVRPWITATVQAIFGTERVVFEQHSEPIADAVARTVNVSAQILVAASGALIQYREELTRDNDTGLVFDVIYSGRPDDFDEIRTGRKLTFMHEVTQTRLDQEPAEPKFLGGAFKLLHEGFPLEGSVIDPITQQVLQYTTTHRRRYQYAPSPSSPVPIRPAPLGGNNGRATTTRESVDDDVLKLSP